MSVEFVPRDILLSAFHRWWVIAAAVLLGGLAGLGVHALRPTVYESRFEVLLNLDQTSSGELERFEEDIAFDAAGVILGGAQTVQLVAKAAEQAGIDVTPEELAKMASVERRRSTWMVRLRGTDPQRVETLTGVWMETGFAALQDAHEHALRADGILRSLTSLESCLARSANSRPAEGLCGIGDLKEVQAEMERSGLLLAQEQKGARGLTGFVLVGSAEKALLPPQAVANQRGLLAAAGALIGLVVGVWISQINIWHRQERS